MILRLVRARIRPGAEAELLARLRAYVALDLGDAGPTDLTYAFRHEEGVTTFLGLSVWSSFAVLGLATDGDLSRPVRWIELDDVCETLVTHTYERLPPRREGRPLADGGVLGLVSGIVKPNAEAVAQGMIDRSIETALAAGALAAHRGRRLSDRDTEIIVVAEWPDRETLDRFVRSRDVGALDPRFIDLMVEWRFETYDVLSPDRLVLPAAGPAVLIVDDEGRYLDASLGVERLLGAPGVLLIGRPLADLVADADFAGEAWQRFRLEGEQEGIVDLRGFDGRTIRLRYRAATDVPLPGRHASVLSLPSEARDDRSVADIVAEVMRSEAGTTAGRR